MSYDVLKSQAYFKQRFKQTSNMGLQVRLWTRSKSDGSYPVTIYISAQGKHTYYTIKGVSCKTNEFDNKTGRIKRTRINWQSMNSTIASTYNRFEKIMLDYPDANISKIVDMYEVGASPLADGKLIPFAEHFVEQCKSGEIKRAVNTYKQYTTVINHLKDFNPDIRFTDINKNFYNTFTSLLRNDYKHKENTIGGTIKIIKVFLNEANERGICNVMEHKKKYFLAIQEETDAIYLTEDELSKMIEIDLYSNQRLAEERDRFIAATYLLLRWSDSIRAGRVNFFEEDGTTYFRQRHQKTNNEVVVPIKPIVKQIFERNNYVLHFVSAQKSNERLRDLGKLLAETYPKSGYNESVSVNGEIKKKFELITTHTARRSGATNAYLSGLDKKALMDFGGWTTENHMLKYIRVSKLETAKLMADHSFFR